MGEYMMDKGMSKLLWIEVQISIMITCKVVKRIIGKYNFSACDSKLRLL